MDNKQVKDMQSQFDALAKRVPDENIEFWFARDLQEPLGYACWENFLVVVRKAVKSCESTGYDSSDHFRDVTKMVPLGSGSEREINDFLPTLTIAAKNLATEMTNHNVLQADLQGEKLITDEHVQNNKSVREMLGQRGIQPEKLAAEEDIKKLERRVKSESRKLDELSPKLPDISHDESDK